MAVTTPVNFSIVIKVIFAVAEVFTIAAVKVCAHGNAAVSFMLTAAKIFHLAQVNEQHRPLPFL